MEFLIQYHLENNSLLLDHYYSKALNICSALNSHLLNKAQASFIKGNSSPLYISAVEASEDCDNCVVQVEATASLPSHLASS